MCLAEPLKVVGVDGKNARVRIEGRIRIVDASLLANLKKGDYILLHGNLAIQKLERKDSEETLMLIREMEL